MYIDPWGLQVYVIYDNREEGWGFRNQAFNSPYYNNDDVIFLPFITMQEFIDGWNSMGDDITGIHIFVHGATGVLHFSGGESLRFSGGTKSFSELETKNVSGTIYLLSCHGGSGREGNNVAWMFAQKTGATVRATANPVSFSNVNGFFIPRVGRHGLAFGVWRNFYYDENGRARNPRNSISIWSDRRFD
jgi:hypothetical protein